MTLPCWFQQSSSRTVTQVYFHLASTGLQGAPFGHVDNYSYNFEEPALYGLIFLMFFFNGAGPLSVDGLIYDSISEETDEGGTA